VRTHRSTVLLGVVAAAGLVMAQQACSIGRKSGEPVAFNTPSASPSAAAPSPAQSSAAPASSSSASSGGGASAGGGAGAILAGKRQIVIAPIPSFESIVAVDAEGRLNVTNGEAEHGLFVLTPVNGKYQIKTAKAGAGGEPSCMGVKSNGSASLTVVAAACDAGRAGQLFTITEQKAKDAKGRPTYAISNQGAFLQVFPKGLIAEELGDSELETTYAFVDNGPSTLPALD
jgi:hypothetical protein